MQAQGSQTDQVKSRATTMTTPAPTGISASPEISLEELQLAGRNHSMPVEGLRYDVTPIGLHYLLIHFDIPRVDAAQWRLGMGGLVRNPFSVGLEDLKSRPAMTLEVTLECAGNGRARLSPRPISQPWLDEAVGNAAWTGTPLRPLLEEAGLLDDAVEVVFTGLDRGVQGGVEQQYERSLAVGDAMRDEVFLAYAINGQPLPPQHGFPVRLVAPGWYGMTHVKWLRSITAIDHAFTGYQQTPAYHVTPSADVIGEPVTRILPRALMVPPGVPDFLSRARYLTPGPHLIEGRAWSGRGAVVRVEVSADGGRSWAEADLSAANGPHAWRSWRFTWDATRDGEYQLCCRATDEAGNIQPLVTPWNAQGVCNNTVQQIAVWVGRELATSQPAADGQA